MVMRWIHVFLVGLVCPACLSDVYQIDQQELRRLAARPAPERGEQVRATQVFGRSHHPRTERERRRRERPRTEAAVVASAGAAAIGTLANSSRRRRARRRNGSRGGRAAGTAVAVAAGVVVLAGVTVVGGVLALGVEEARRFEGHVEMHPGHALYLRGGDGRRPMWRHVRLTDLTPELAEWSNAAIVDARDGYIDELSRARLDRRGFFTSLEGAFGTTNEGRWVGGLRLHAGVFPIQYLGLAAIVDFQGAGRHLQTRVGGEVQAFAPRLARLHLGAYVESGSIRERVPGDGQGVLTNPFVGGGGILQLDVMTRLSFDIRGGMWWAPDGVRPTFAIGFTVY